MAAPWTPPAEPCPEFEEVVGLGVHEHPNTWSRMRLNILGPVEATVDGRHVALGDAKQRAILAMLGLEANRAVTADRLIAGLRARLKSEIEYIDRVVLAVQTGKLPQRMVDQTFFWARQRASVSRFGSTQRPIIYFQFAMTARAKRIGVEL